MLNEIYYLIVRVSKRDSSFLYFQMEANEGICFYSTLEGEKENTYRDIDIKTDLSLKEEVIMLISQLRQEITIEIIEEKEE